MSYEKEKGSIEDSPLLLGTPASFFSFFGGPLFPGTHDFTLKEHYKKIKIPLNILKDEERKGRLLGLLVSINPSPSLFTGESNLSYLLSEILQQKHLYQRWKQKIGGRERLICVPQKAFKEFLKNYVVPFVKTIPVHESCHGGEKSWTVRKSLEYHLPVVSSLTFDMENATSQATMNYVFGFFYDSLEGKCEDEEQRRDAAVFLSAVCTIRKKSDKEKTEFFEAHLPQGSHVGSAIFNRMLHPIDTEFSRFAGKKGMKYSRWMDDFIFTSPKKRKFDNFAYLMRNAQESFTLAPDKVFFTHTGDSYMLGHKIFNNQIEKLDREEFERQRGEPYTGFFLSSTHPFDGMYEGLGEPDTDPNNSSIPF